MIMATFMMIVLMLFVSGGGDNDDSFWYKKCTIYSNSYFLWPHNYDHNFTLYLLSDYRWAMLTMTSEELLWHH